MTRFLPQVIAVLETFDKFLALFATMVIEQRTAPYQGIIVKGGASLSDSMAAAQSVVMERKQNLKISLTNQDSNEFVRQMTDLAFDMSHFEFSLRHLKRNNEYLKLKEQVSEQAADLSRTLLTGNNEDLFAAELKAQK